MPETVHVGEGSCVSGTVFEDVDQDGIQDPSEHALEGVSVFADLNGNQVFDGDDIQALSGYRGGFTLNSLPTGSYDIRAILPDGYKTSDGCDESASVSIASTEGVAGLSFGMVRSGFDIGVSISEVSLEQVYQTGKRVKLPVIVTNRGDTALPAGKLRLAVYLSGDQVLSNQDVRLKVFKVRQEIAAGETVKFWLRLKLPYSLADFNSYVMVQAGGRQLLKDLNTSDHVAVSADPVLFKASKRRSQIDPDQVGLVSDNWNNTSPYGGYAPGYGYTGGTYDSTGTTTLIPWNPGTSPGGVYTTGGGVIASSYFAPRSYIIEGDPATVSGVFFHDRNANGIQDANEQGLSGMQVRVFDTDMTAISGSDGRFEITGIPTEIEITETYSYGDGWEETSRKSLSESIYLLVDVPDGWRPSEDLSTFRKVSVYSGCHVGNINFGIYALPQIESVVVEGGSITQSMPTTINAEGVFDPDGTVERVVFFYDEDGDRRGDDVLGIDDDGSDGFSINLDGLAGFEANSSAKVIAIAEDNDGHLCLADTDTELRYVYEVSADKSLVYREADGTIVTLSMAGPGSAVVSIRCDGPKAFDLGDVVELSGDVTLLDIELDQTTAESGLSVLTSKGKGSLGRAQMLGSVYGSSVLGAFAAHKLDMTRGGVQMTGQGVIERLAIGSANEISMPGTGVDEGLRIVAGLLKGDITLGSSLARLKSLNMTGVDLSAPLADQIIVKNNYAGGSITLNESAFSGGMQLLSVGSRMQGVKVNTMSAIDTIAVGWMLNSSVHVGSLTNAAGAVQTTSDAAGREVFGGVLNVYVGAFMDSYISAWEIGTVKMGAAIHSAWEYPFGLTYHTLESYQGPDTLVMNQI